MDLPDLTSEELIVLKAVRAGVPPREGGVLERLWSLGLIQIRPAVRLTPTGRQWLELHVGHATVALFCAHCGGPVTVTYEPLSFPLDTQDAGIWHCPHPTCGRENAVQGVRVQAVETRDLERIARRSTS